MNISLDEQIKCVGRELGMRRNVYPKFIQSGRMTEEKAMREIHAMEAVYETLKACKKVADAIAHD